MSTQEDRVPTVGVREFREKAASYLAGSAPIAVTRHGRVIGFYVPVPPDQDEVRRAFERLEQALDSFRAQRGSDPRDQEESCPRCGEARRTYIRGVVAAT